MRPAKPLTVGTARELRNRVAVRFGKRSDMMSFPEHITLYEVPFIGRPRFHESIEAMGALANDRRFRSRQRFDVLAVGVWPSSKGLIHGFELKVSRADLLHELRDLSKSEHAARLVDRFWLVLGDKSLLREDDPVPESWGILVAVGRGLRVIRDAAPQPGEFDRSLLLGIATRALVTPRMGGEARYRDGLNRGYTSMKDQLATAYRQRDDSNRRRDEAFNLGVVHGRAEAERALAHGGKQG